MWYIIIFTLSLSLSRCMDLCFFPWFDTSILTDNSDKSEKKKETNKTWTIYQYLVSINIEFIGIDLPYAWQYDNGMM